MRNPMLLGTIQCRTPGLNCGNGLERVRGIEPPSRAWEALILPLNYTRVGAEPSTSNVATRGAHSVSVRAA
jgi:hypothetical protein